MNNIEDCLNRGLGNVNYIHPDRGIFEKMQKQYNELCVEMHNLYGSLSINDIIYQIKEKNNNREIKTIGDSVDQIKSEMRLDKENIDKLKGLINHFYVLAHNNTDPKYSPEYNIPFNFITIIYQLINYSGLEKERFQAPCPLNFSDTTSDVKQFIKYYILSESFNKIKTSNLSRIIRIVVIIIFLAISLGG